MTARGNRLVGWALMSAPALGSRRSDELFVVSPRRLARELAQPLRVTVAAGYVSRVEMRLPRFSRRDWFPPRPNSATVSEPVSLDVAFENFGRRLELRRPRRFAME